MKRESNKFPIQWSYVCGMMVSLGVLLVTPNLLSQNQISRSAARSASAAPASILLGDWWISEFNQVSLTECGWGEIPGGFTPNTPAGTINLRAIDPSEIASTQDYRGIEITIQPGQVTFLYTLDSLDTGGYPVLMRLYARAGSAGAQIALAALKGNLAAGLVDGSIVTHVPANSASFINQEQRLVLLYEPDTGTEITPVIQVAGLDQPTQVVIDRLEIIRIPAREYSQTVTSDYPPSDNFAPYPYLVYEFNQATLADNQWSEIPGGFIQKSPGMVIPTDLPAGAVPSSQDQKGLLFFMQSDQVSLIYPNQPIATAGYPLMLRLTVRADGPGASVALAALKGNLYTLENVDNSIATLIPQNSAGFIPTERRLVMMYEPDTGETVTPLIQVASAADVGFMNVIVEKLEVFVLDPAVFGLYKSTIPTPSPTPISTPEIPPIPTPTPVIPNLNPVPIPALSGGKVNASDNAFVEFAPGFAQKDITAGFEKTGDTAGQTTEELQIISGEYDLEITTDQSVHTDILMTVPISQPIAEDSHPLSVQVYDEATGTWQIIYSFVYYDAATQSVTFSVPIDITVTQETDAAESGKVIRTAKPLEDPTFLGVKYRRKYRVYIPTFYGQFETSLEESDFRIHYYPKSVKSNDKWSSVGSGQYADDLVPDYIEDLDKALNEALKGLLAIQKDDGTPVFSDPRAGWIGKNKIDICVINTGTADGITAPRGWLSGTIQIHESKLENWSTMRAVAAHELCHYLQGDYYSLGGKPAAWLFGNRWFFEATAEYYASRAMSMNAAQKAAYWGETMADYLSVPIIQENEASYYTLAHFLDWLENVKYPGKAIVASALNQKLSQTNDQQNLSSAIIYNNSVGEGLGDAFKEYCTYVFTNPDDARYDGLNKKIKEAMLKDIPNYINPANRRFSLSKDDKPSVTYVHLQKRLDVLSTAYIQLTQILPEESLLVVLSESQGEGLATTSTLTYAPLGDSDSFYAQTEPIDKTWVITLPFTVKNFGGPTGVASFEQMFVNRGFANMSTLPANLNIHYYVLVKPEVKEVKDGEVHWSTVGMGKIPPELIAGYDVYIMEDADSKIGSKINPTPIPYVPKEQSYLNPVIKKDNTILISIKDKKDNVWPEVESSPIAGKWVGIVTDQGTNPDTRWDPFEATIDIIVAGKNKFMVYKIEGGGFFDEMLLDYQDNQLNGRTYTREETNLSINEETKIIAATVEGNTLKGKYTITVVYTDKGIQKQDTYLDLFTFEFHKKE